jgi:hypothetical protein
MVGVTLSSLLILGLVAVGASQALGRRSGTAAPPSQTVALPDPVTITALIGTEKRSYFTDPKVKQRLAELVSISSWTPLPLATWPTRVT